MHIQNKLWRTFSSNFKLLSVNLSRKRNKCHDFFSLILNNQHLHKRVDPCKRNSLFTYCTYARFYSTLKQHALVSDVTQDIDIEGLKDKCRQHELMTGSKLSVKDLVKKELTQRFDQALEKLSEQEQRKLKIIQLEHSFLFSEGYAIPSPEEMTSKDWLDAITVETMEQRLWHYVSLVDRKETERNTSTSRADCDPSQRICDRSDTIFYDPENPELQVRWGNYRLASAMQHGHPLVIDMDYVNMTTPVELDYLCQQLWDLYCVNRSSPDPYHLIFTNCPEDNPIYRHLSLHYMIETPQILATFTEESHMDLFAPHQMVYLSAQSKSGLTVYDPETVYILGAYHDPLVHKKGSFVKARQERLLSMRLPIDEHMKWRHQAPKDLDLNLITGILLSVKANMTWKEAFRSNIPTFVREKKQKHKLNAEELGRVSIFSSHLK